jgi:hypothetical protein
VIIDSHVHLVGNGSNGSGCWYRPRGSMRWAEPFFWRPMGIRSRELRGDLDQAYLDRLLEFRRTSSVEALALFAQDEVYRPDGTRWEGRGTFYVPNDVVLGLARRHPDLLPVVSIHPARPDALAELERCVAAGAVALKLLPNCHGVDCRLPQYRRFWEQLAAHRLPLIAHTGAENVVDVVSPAWADPRLLRGPLEAGVTVIAAHCGIGTTLFSRDYFPAFRAMLAEFPRLYGDTAALNLPSRFHRLRACLRPELAGRLLHGSDLPVPVLAHPGLVAGLLGVRAWWRLRRIRNPLERDYRLKRAMGFPDAVFTRAAGLLRLSAKPVRDG